MEKLTSPYKWGMVVDLQPCEKIRSRKQKSEQRVRQTIVVSGRGQITLPLELRKRFGIMNGGAIILEKRENEVVLKPTKVRKVEMYSDAQIIAWDKADRLDMTAGKRVLKRPLGRKRRA